MKNKIGSKNSTIWFIEPNNAKTNKIIADMLAATHNLVENNSMSDVDGNFHSVFEVPNYSFINKLYKSKDDFSLDFTVYNKRGKYGKLRPWLFGAKKKAKKI
jgi:hypothetical protein